MIRIVSCSNFLVDEFVTNAPFRHEVFFAAASDSYRFTGPFRLIRKNGWMITASLCQPKRTSRRSVKAHPRCGSKKDLVTPFMPGFLNKILRILEKSVLLFALSRRFPKYGRFFPSGVRT